MSERGGIRPMIGAREDQFKVISWGFPCSFRCRFHIPPGVGSYQPARS